MSESTAIEILPPEAPTQWWPQELAREIKVAGSASRICEKYGITKEKYRELREDPLFQLQMRENDKALAKPEAMFRAKATAYSPEMLDVLRSMALGEAGSIPARDKAEAAKTIVKFAGLDASENRAQATAAAGLVININLA